MALQDVKTIPLYQLVQHLGGTYSHTDGNKHVWYFSPFRPNEKTASFKIDEAKNRWFDFGHVARTTSGNGSGGDILDLWCDYHGKDRKTGFKGALEALEAFTSPSIRQARPDVYRRPAEKIGGDAIPQGSSRFEIVQLHTHIHYASLAAELKRRRISVEVAARYLSQVYFRDTVHPDKKYNGFAFQNDNGGYELSCPNPKLGTCFKTSTKPKAISTFRAMLSSKLFVFEGFWDFLSWLEMQDTVEPEHNIAVLNSLSFAGLLIKHIVAAKDRIDTVVLFLDNDDAGVKATHFMSNELNGEGFTVRPMESLYQHYKDLSDYWAKDPSAKKITEQNKAQAKYYTDDSATAMVMNRGKGKPGLK